MGELLRGFRLGLLKGAQQVPRRVGRYPHINVLFPAGSSTPSAARVPSAARAAPTRRSPLRHSQGATTSPRHTPRLAPFAAVSSATYLREYLRYANAPARTHHPCVDVLTPDPAHRDDATVGQPHAVVLVPCRVTSRRPRPAFATPSARACLPEERAGS